MFEITGLREMYLDQNPQSYMKNQMDNFNEADLQKAYSRTHGKYYETVTIAGRSRQIGKKLQARANTASPLGLNIAPSKNLSIALCLTRDATVD